MIVERLIVGSLEENTYIVFDEKSKDAIVIDPGDEGDRINDLIKGKGLKVGSIVCTHAHFDHVGAAGEIKASTGAKILLHKDDVETYSRAKEQGAFWGINVDDLPDPDAFLGEGDQVKAGDLTFKVMHSPGHSPGGICLYGEGIVITGDTIFNGSVGRTDFPGGSIEKLKDSFRRLLELPDDTKVYSGHGPETTIGDERVSNFFVNEL
jgi:glyoxylase-like metal-dependent hydrolase (beta-lactamase superfamily II)